MNNALTRRHLIQTGAVTLTGLSLTPMVRGQTAGSVSAVNRLLAGQGTQADMQTVISFYQSTVNIWYPQGELAIPAPLTIGQATALATRIRSQGYLFAQGYLEGFFTSTVSEGMQQAPTSGVTMDVLNANQINKLATLTGEAPPAGGVGEAKSKRSAAHELPTWPCFTLDWGSAYLGIVAIPAEAIAVPIAVVIAIGWAVGKIWGGC